MHLNCRTHELCCLSLPPCARNTINFFLKWLNIFNFNTAHLPSPLPEFTNSALDDTAYIKAGSHSTNCQYFFYKKNPQNNYTSTIFATNTY